MMCERALSRTTQGELLGRKQLVQEMIADSWIEMEQFRLLVMRTAWRIDKYKDYKRVRKDISAVKAAMPKVFHDVAARALQIHGSLGVSEEMPFSAMVIESFHMGLADGPTEVHKVTVARQILSRVPADRRAVPDRPPPDPPRRGDGPLRRRHRAPRRPAVTDRAAARDRTGPPGRGARLGRARGPPARQPARAAGRRSRRCSSPTARPTSPTCCASATPSSCCAGRRSASSRPAPTT